MSRRPALYQWNSVVAKSLPHLSKPMAACLALWSLGMILARSCSLTTVAWVWVPILKQKFFTVRERLRDLYREAPSPRPARNVPPSIWVPVGHPGWHGLSKAGTADNSLWRSMLPRSGNGSSSWP